MKRISLLVSFFLLSLGSVSAQSVETGIQLYQDGDYERALLVFEQYDEPLATLFTGKSYFALGEYFKARNVLNSIEDNSGEISLESQYTLALTDFQLKNFARSLDRLNRISSEAGNSSLRRNAVSFYSSLLNYLTPSQRFQVFRASEYDEVRLDILESSIGNVDYGMANALFQAYKGSLGENANTNNRLSSIASLLSDSVSYMQRYQSFTYPEAPEGISYNLGVALPQFDAGTEQYEITQNLYFGIQLAVDRYNGEYSGKKVFLNFADTRSNPDASSSVFTHLVWNAYSDAIIGPLFSEVASEFSRSAEMYEIPLLLPLANSDSINMDQNYTFQFNPTFAVQGKKMAEYAYQTLNYDTVAVIAESNSLGESSAIAFYETFSRLGGNVVKYDIHDLESQGYDIRDYTSYLNPEIDTTFNVNVDAIYAPFTGIVASTLINSLITEIEAADNDITILGSEEWEASNPGISTLDDNLIFYTQSFSVSADNMDKDQFDSEFRLRFDTNPNRFAYIGYDVAQVFLSAINRVQNPAYLKEGLKSVSNYQGFSMNVDFSGQHINQAVNIKQLNRSEE